MPTLSHVRGNASDMVRPKINNTVSQVEIYRQLDSGRREIRVLWVYPGTGSDSIVCSLERVSLLAERKPDYETISYVWGNRDLRGTILISGRPLDVPVSSVTALKRMRLPDRRRSLWLDAVCINQQDTVERGQQVAFMHEIYAKGRRNLIWLGEYDKYTKRALVEVSRLLEDFRAETNNLQDAERVLFTRHGNREYSTTPLSIKIKDWKALSRLYTNPWFSRLWIVQEAASSSSNICYSGKFEFQLEDVLRAALWVKHKSLHIHSRTEDWTFFPVNITSFTDPICRNSVGRSQVHNKSLAATIRSLADFQTCDPRDHVYGILGLYQMRSKDQEISSLVLPNYNLRTAEVFRDAAKLAVTKQGGLSVLNDVLQRPEDDHSEWPSWVPRWHRYNRLCDPQIPAWPHFKAACGVRQPLPLAESEDEDVIALAGFVADSVCDLSPVIPYLERRPFDRREKQLTEVFEFARTLASDAQRHQSDIISTETIAATLIVSTNERRRRADETLCVRGYKALIAGLTNFSGPKDINDTSFKDPSVSSKLAAAFYMAMSRACSNRRLLCTSSGRLGAGPRTTQSGDIVVILYGSAVPFVLRPSQKHSKEATHEFIGGCYIHGIMDGEAVQEHRAACKKDEWFYLR